VLGDDYILNFPEGEQPGEGMNLAEFVRACQQVTDINFTYADDTRNFLTQKRITLLGTKTVPKKDFYSFFQIIMFINDFVCVEVGEGSLSVIKIESLQGGGGRGAQSRADGILVDEEDLPQYAAQPATRITTVINLPNTDVRNLANNLRTLMPDQTFGQMLAAGNSNAIILTGYGSTVAAMARMLRIVDEASKTEVVTPVFEVLQLEYAAADEIASLVEELLDAGRRATQGQNRPQQGATTQISAGQAEAKILVDPRSNRLLVMAMPEDMPQIKELVAKLDIDILERAAAYHIYPLENVKAEELAETLNEFLQDAGRVEQGQAQGGNAARGGAAGGQSTEFVVVPDEETNSLLIAASRTRYEELLSLIRRLDRRQPQVLIETALIELTSRDFLDIGVELGLADVTGDGGFGVTNFGLSAFEDLDADGIVDSRVPNNGTGITAGILDGDNFSLPMLLSLVEQKSNSNVLNVPSVLVNNNGSAKVEALESQPTTQITNTGTVGGTQENFNGYQDAGITMQISPSISASRYLRLDIFLNVSTFQGSFSGPIPPPKVERSVETTVNVPDGDTMVIGGIVIDNRSEDTDQVPGLGDLPIVGRLFRRDSDTQNRTALYFFVTPHILQDADFADLAEISYRRKLEAADTIGLDRMRLIESDFGTQEDAGSVDLEGFDLPLYQRPTVGEEVDAAEIGKDPSEVMQALGAVGGTDS
jgi:general secretion pathway protein D